MLRNVFVVTLMIASGAAGALAIEPFLPDGWQNWIVARQDAIAGVGESQKPLPIANRTPTLRPRPTATTLRPHPTATMPSPTLTATLTPAPTWLDDIDGLEQAIHAEANRYRVSKGVGPLVFRVEIQAKARGHSETLAESFAATEQIFHSVGLFTETLFECGENILSHPRATSSTLINGVVVSRQNDIEAMSVDELAERLIQQWIDSPGHERNLRTAHYTASGVGVYYDRAQERLFGTHNLCFRR